MGGVGGVLHGLEPVKHCFSWQGRWRGGASASGGGGVGMDWEPLKHCFSWPGRKILLFMVGALRWGR